jgi:hypothetical protein
VHLPHVGVSEAPQFQIYHDQTAELAMKKEQVDTIPLVANPQPTLASNEGKISAQLQQKRLKMKDQGSLSFGLIRRWEHRLHSVVTSPSLLSVQCRTNRQVTPIKHGKARHALRLKHGSL